MYSMWAQGCQNTKYESRLISQRGLKLAIRRANIERKHQVNYYLANSIHVCHSICVNFLIMHRSSHSIPGIKYYDAVMARRNPITNEIMKLYNEKYLASIATRKIQVSLIKQECLHSI